MTPKRGLSTVTRGLWGLALMGLFLVAPVALAAPPSPKSTGAEIRKETVATSPNISIDVVSDDAPPSTYDLTHGQAAHGVHPETTQLLWQLVRTVVALAAVLALIFVLAKVLLPRLSHRFTAGDPALLQVKSRLRLDENHQVVLLEIRGKQEVLLALGPAGVQLICSVPPPEGKPTPTFAVEAERLLGNP